MASSSEWTSQAILSEPFRRGVCLVISAPSGAGKSTIANALRAADVNLDASISVTTRSARPGEKEGVHYYFRTPKEFFAMAERGELLEWAKVFGYYYGTPRQPVEDSLMQGRDIVFDIDWQGHRQIRESLPADTVGLFVLPPSLEELDRRLLNRGSNTSKDIQQRMRNALKEISHWQEFDYVIANNDLNQAIREARSVLVAARLACSRQRGVAGLIAGDSES